MVAPQLPPAYNYISPVDFYTTGDVLDLLWFLSEHIDLLFPPARIIIFAITQALLNNPSSTVLHAPTELQGPWQRVNIHIRCIGTDMG